MVHKLKRQQLSTLNAISVLCFWSRNMLYDYCRVHFYCWRRNVQFNYRSMVLCAISSSKVFAGEHFIPQRFAKDPRPGRKMGSFPKQTAKFQTGPKIERTHTSEHAGQAQRRTRGYTTAAWDVTRRTAVCRLELVLGWAGAKPGGPRGPARARGGRARRPGGGAEAGTRVVRGRLTLL